MSGMRDCKCNNLGLDHKDRLTQVADRRMGRRSIFGFAVLCRYSQMASFWTAGGSRPTQFPVWRPSDSDWTSGATPGALLDFAPFRGFAPPYTTRASIGCSKTRAAEASTSDIQIVSATSKCRIWSQTGASISTFRRPSIFVITNRQI